MIYKMELTTEEINVVRNGLNYILSNKNNNLSKKAIYWYKRVKNIFDKEYSIQQSQQLKLNNEIIKPNYKERNCSDCMDFRSKQDFTEIDGYYFCGLCRPFACEMFKVDSQTC